MILRFIILGIASVVLGLIHGSISGFDMPAEARSDAPDIDAFLKNQNSGTTTGDSETPDVIVVEKMVIEDAEPKPAESGEFTVDRLFESWASGVATIYDARTEEEFLESHIAGAIHLPLEKFETGLPTDILMLPPDQLMIVYCGGGDCHASHSVGALLQEYGYENVYVFEPGYPAWVDAGFPVE